MPARNGADRPLNTPCLLQQLFFVPGNRRCDSIVNQGGASMELFDTLSEAGHEQIVFYHNRALRMTRTIYYNVSRIFAIAERDGIPSWQAADRMAEERIHILGKLKLPHMGKPHRFPGRERNHAH
jgi:hypothetical protein